MTNAIANIEASMVDKSGELRAAAERIHGLMARTARNIVEIGRELIAVKEQLGHGEFLGWIDSQFSMSDQSARRFMQVAEHFGKSNTMLNLGATVLYELSAPSTSQEVRDVVEQKVAVGETVSAADVKRLKKLEKQNETLKAALEKAEKGKPAEVRELQSNVVRLQANNAELASENAALTAQNMELAGEVEELHASTVAFAAATSKAIDAVAELPPIHVSVMGGVAAFNRISVVSHDEFWRVDDVSRESARREIDRAVSRLQSLLAAGSKPVVEIIPPSHSGGALEMPPIPKFLDRRETATAE